jgi:hypothetical protein
MSKLSVLIHKVTGLFDGLATHIALPPQDADNFKVQLVDLLTDLFDGRSDGDPEIREFMGDVAGQALAALGLRLRAIENRLGLTDADFPATLASVDPTLKPPILTGEAVEIVAQPTPEPVTERVNLASEAAPIVAAVDPVALISKTDADGVARTASDDAYRAAGFAFNPVTGAPLN